MSNWKTTATGVAAGGALVASNPHSWWSILAGILIAALGVVAKDFNVSGV